MLRFEKWEIHTVFPHFPNLAWKQNLSLPALADLIRASLFHKARVYFAAREGVVSGVTVEGTGTEAFGAASGIFSARI